MDAKAAVYGNTARTYSVWLNVPNTGQEPVWTVGTGVTGNRFASYVNISGGPYVSYNNDDVYQGSGALAAGWHHFAVIYDGQGYSTNHTYCYVDGKARSLSSVSGTTSASINTLVTPNYLGKGWDANYFVGQMDTFEIYTQAFSSVQISTLFSLGRR